MNIDKIGLSAIWTDWSKALEKIIMPNQDENVPIMFDESPDEEPAVDIDYNDPKNQFSQTGLNITKFKNTVSRAEAFENPSGFVTDEASLNIDYSDPKNQLAKTDVDIDYNDPKNQLAQTGLNITKFKNTVSRAEAFKSPKGFVTDD